VIVYSEPKRTSYCCTGFFRFYRSPNVLCTRGSSLDAVGFVVLRVMLSGIPYGYAYVTPHTLRCVLQRADCPRIGNSVEFSAIPSDVLPTDWGAADTVLPDFVGAGNASWAFVDCLILVVSALSDTRFRVATFRSDGGAWLTPGLRAPYCPDDVAAYARWEGMCDYYE
jgi:hypothetical protein